jgi:tetratricopeptide (TPR) repeat protein
LSLVVAGRGWSRTQPTAGDVPAPLALAGRVWIWRASGDAALTYLPFGAGLGRFPHAFLDAQGARLAELGPGEAARRFQNATSAHDDYLEVTVDSGLPALLLLGGALAAGLAAHARGRAAWPAGAATVLVFAVCALGDSPLGQPAAVGLLALVLAAGRRPARRTRAVPALAWLGAAALLAPTLAAYLAMRRATLADDAAPPERLARLASAARLDPRSGEIALSLGLAELSLGDAAAALPELERSRALLANVGTDVAIGNAQLLLGDPTAADAAYRRALAHDPGSFRAHANRIEALRQLGRLDEAAHELAVARQLEPTHPGLDALADRLGR